MKLQLETGQENMLVSLKNKDTQDCIFNYLNSVKRGRCMQFKKEIGSCICIIINRNCNYSVFKK